MEPEATELRRPGGVTFLAILANVAGLSCAVAAYFTDFPLSAAIAAYAAMRLFTGWGLLRLKRYGWILEQISAIAWIVFAGLIAWRTPEAIGFLLPGTMVSVAEIFYLNRPLIRGRFRAPQAGRPRAAIAGWYGLSLAVAVVIAAVVIPNILTMSGGNPQKRTMADMRTIGTAWEARATDINRYNAAAISFPTGGVTQEQLVRYLSPTYVKVFPMKDGWKHAWQFGIDQPWGTNEPAQVYAIVSYGKDGKSQGKWEGGATTQFDCDIVYSNGTFLQYPEGIQQQ
jgi:uncharacterized protein (DUF736 family)